MLEAVDNVLSEDDSRILQAGFLDTPFFCSHFFPEYFDKPFAEKIHGRIFDTLDARNSEGKPLHKKVVIAAPRGSGKTSIMRQGYVAKAILYRTCPFVMFVSKSLTVASAQTENLKRSLLQKGTEIRRLFKSIHSRNDAETEEQFSKEAWVATLPEYEGQSLYRGNYMGTLILPRGMGQQVRGWLFGPHRPGLIIIDDLEDDNLIDNDELRKSWHTWVMGSLKETIDQWETDDYEADYQVIYCDTMKHEDSVLSRMMELDDWTVLDLPLAEVGKNGKFYSLAPEFKSDKAVRKKVAEFRDAHRMDIFYREFMNQPAAAEDALFREEYFKYYNEPQDLQDNPYIESVVLADPATSITPQADFSAAVCIGLDTFNNALYVRDVVAGRYYPEEFYKEVFEMARRFQAAAVGYERSMLGEYISQPLEMFMVTAGYMFELIPLKPKKGEGAGRGGNRNKSRINALAVYYRQGRVYHNRTCCMELEGELLSHPRSRRDDVADAFSYVVGMVEEGGRFFTPDDKDSDKYDDPAYIEAEYADLKDEPCLTGWEVI